LRGHGQLTDDELNLITGTLELHSKVANDVTVPLEKVFSIGLHETLDHDTIQKIIGQGHSRVPVWKTHPDNLIGVLLIKQLIGVDTNAGMPVDQLQIMPMLLVDTSMPLFALLRRFVAGTSHIAAVHQAFRDENMSPDWRGRSNSDLADSLEMTSSSQNPVQVIGILTLEDVLEQLLMRSIEDETDVLRPIGERFDSRMTKVRELRSGLLGAIQKSGDSSRSRENEATRLLGPESTSAEKKNSKKKKKKKADQEGPGHNRGVSYGSLNSFSSAGSSTSRYDLESESAVLRLIGEQCFTKDNFES